MTVFLSESTKTFIKNGGTSGTICYELTCNTDRIFQVNAYLESKESHVPEHISSLGKGMRSIYMLSLLESYLEDEERVPGMILMEDPEIFLHPTLQKKSSEILYRLSRKSQVIFTTHSPNLLFQFNSRQIRQMVLDEDGYSVIRSHTNLSAILDDLGFTASDLLNVSFVFIVEGKQDKSRLPLLLEKYYSEIYDQKGNLSRISIYSFENYFLDPKIMEKIGVIKSEDDFYEILLKKWNEYLYKLNIFYGRFRKNETEILKSYIEEAPRDTFKDILDAIDRFVYFENRKK